MLMYCLIGKIKVNWVSVIKEHIIKIRKKFEYHIPYVVLISQFIEYFKIDVEDDVVETVKAKNEISVVTLIKIGLKKINDDYWLCKADGDGLVQQQEEEGEGVGTSVAAVEAEGGYDAHMSVFPPVGYENYLVVFEERMMSQLHTMHDDSRSHHQYCEERFQNIEGMVEDVQHKIGHIFYGLEH